MIAFSPVVAILGPRQCGKTTLARMILADHYFDLENPRDLARLENPQTALEGLKGLVVIDEIQLRPDLFSLLRYLVDQSLETQYLILGSASRDLIRQGNETLAGRILFLHLQGFTIDEVGVDSWKSLWWRGGFPRAFLAPSDEMANKWLEDYISTFLERDIPQFGIRISPATLRRFWIMLSHYHGNIVNFSELGRSLQIADTTIRHYVDILESTFMIRVLRPWFTNTSKRLVKRPKIYMNDSGLFHRLQGIEQRDLLESHPKLGASWEGYALNQLIQISGLSEDRFFFWATQAGAEVDLFWQSNGKNYAAEFKYNDAPRRTKSITAAMAELELEHLWIIYPGTTSYPIDTKISVTSIREIAGIFHKSIVNAPS
ncbi:MAG: ATP-binding protein [Akkermansiaceae bacterium]|nr:ATP-binding protein [Akkermansiaceae bacterium]